MRGERKIKRATKTKGTFDGATFSKPDDGRAEIFLSLQTYLSPFVAHWYLHVVYMKGGSFTFRFTVLMWLPWQCVLWSALGVRGLHLVVWNYSHSEVTLFRAWSVAGHPWLFTEQISASYLALSQSACNLNGQATSEGLSTSINPEKVTWILQSSLSRYATHQEEVVQAHIHT